MCNVIKLINIKKQNKKITNKEENTIMKKLFGGTIGCYTRCIYDEAYICCYFKNLEPLPIPSVPNRRIGNYTKGGMNYLVGGNDGIYYFVHI